jgi:hypothetical protein
MKRTQTLALARQGKCERRYTQIFFLDLRKSACICVQIFNIIVIVIYFR